MDGLDLDFDEQFFSADMEIEKRACGINTSDEESPIDGPDFASEKISGVVPFVEAKINDDEVVSVDTSSIVRLGVKAPRRKEVWRNESEEDRFKRQENARDRKRKSRANAAAATSGATVPAVLKKLILKKCDCSSST